MTESGHRRRWWIVAHLGYKWVGAIAALLTAVVGLLSFCAVQAAAPDSRARAGAPGSAGPVPLQPPASATGTTAKGVPAGTRLARYTIDIPDYYSVDVSDKQPRPVTGEDEDLYYAQSTVAAGNAVQAATLEGASPTYAACLADTKFASTIVVVPSTNFCVTGRGLVAGFAVTKVESTYLEVDVTVWQAPA